MSVSSRTRQNYIIAFVITIILALWLASGVLFADISESGDENRQANGEDALTSVKVAQLQAVQYPLAISVSGHSEANRRLQLRAQIQGHIVELPIQEGSRVKTETSICRLAPDDRLERLRQGESAVALAQLEYDAALRLKKKGLQSETAIAQAKFELRRARAEFKRQQLDVQHLSIRAPFDGVLDELTVELGDFLQPGDVCGLLLDLDPLIVSAQVSEAEISKLKIGQSVSATLFEVANPVQGRISAIHNSSDLTTRTFRIEAELPNPDGQLRSGLSTRLSIGLDKVQAHRIPASILILDDAGGIGIRILDEQAKVRFMPVNLVGDEIEYVWVTGLPPEVSVITVGQYYVSEGEQVNAVTDASTY